MSTCMLRQMMPGRSDGLLRYDLGPGVTAFSPLRDAVLPFAVLQAHQVHGTRVAVITDPSTQRSDLQGIDALITALPGLAIAARTADCIPVLLHDPVRHVVAAVHAGWRGTVQKISTRVIETMAGTFGTCPAHLRAVVGPGIGPDSFQIGPEVAEAFRTAGFPMDALLRDEGPRREGTMQGGLHLDLWKANAWLLEQSGVPSRQMLVSGVDTYARNDLFFSARREGAGCGRIVNTICLDNRS